MTPYYDDGQIVLYHGDALAVLCQLPAKSVDCAVTSPPYYGLRDYGVEGQYFTATAPNGRILCSSELYTNRDDCVHAAHLAFGADTAALLQGDGPGYWLRVGAR